MPLIRNGLRRRIIPVIAAAAILLGAVAPGPARADNPMGYRLLSAQEASNLPQRHGALGLDVARAQQINDSGMVFDIMRVQQVRPGSPGDQAGFRVGDQLIAVNGLVFPSIKAFAAYIGSLAPGSQIAVDYMPAGGGPEQAQRVSVRLGGAARSAQQDTPAEAQQSGMSTGTKLAIGAGAAALLCYKFGCFSRDKANQAR